MWLNEAREMFGDWSIRKRANSRMVVVLHDAAASLDAGATRMRTAFTGKATFSSAANPFPHHFEWTHLARRIAPRKAADGLAQNAEDVPMPSEG